MSFDAILFDMDGVLIDSEPVWKKADTKFFINIFPNLPEGLEKKYKGQSHSGVHAFFVEHFGLKISLKEFIEKRNEYALNDIYPNSPLFPEVRSFLEKIKGTKKMAIGTSSFTKAAQGVVEKNNLADFFEEVVTSEDVNGIGKPAPDIYLLAAKKLGVDPKKCLVIEDTKNGIMAGKNAGMTVFAYRNHANRNDDLSLADKEFESFEELSLLL